MAIPKTKRRKLKKVDPKPAAKVDDAATVFLVPKPPPPFRSAEKRAVQKQGKSGFWVSIGFSIAITALGFWLFLHSLPN